MNGLTAELAKAAMATCNCSNSRTDGLGAHEPWCMSELGTRFMAAHMKPCTACEDLCEPNSAHLTRGGTMLCGKCWADRELYEHLGRAALRAAGGFPKMSGDEVKARILRLAASMGLRKADVQPQEP